ncbi:MAG TPA: PEP-CTERM sorting domain-containing protein [Acidobacteriaceae bacterium]|jgi:hypothetical protein|nr:PEP-CTERM sorting domain-containing protein [Acidobacteriaceae bacterium]
MHLRNAFALCLFAFAPIAGSAATIATNTAGTATVTTDLYLGQSFTTAAGGPFSNVSFSFLNTSSADYALGTGFLFSSAYTGSPNGLNSGDAGFLGSAVASGGAYTFAPSLTLSGNTQYFFYENALIPGSTVMGDNIFVGGNAAFSTTGTGSFTLNDRSADFVVTGSPVSTPPATPEPSSLVLLGTGILGLAQAGYRKLRA